MNENYLEWLIEQRYAENTQTAQIYRVKKVEKYHGELEEHLKNNTYQEIINLLKYSTQDEKSNKLNPSKIPISGNIRNGLQSYKNAIIRYKKFLTGNTTSRLTIESSKSIDDDLPISEDKNQRLSLERDMQAALRHNITNLNPNLKIIDDGAERSVDSGFIDITCEDDKTIIVVELKAGKADSRAIGQILGYMGDLQEEEGKPVRGILIAHDFDKRTKAAARIVPTLELQKYSIEFNFIVED
jgi:hypothetical protein